MRSIVHSIDGENVMSKLARYVPALLCMLTVACTRQCGPDAPTQDAPRAPLITLQPGTGTLAAPAPRIFGGGIYPVVGTKDCYELDVPLVARDPKGHGDAAYFGFEINYRIEAVRTLELSWESAGTTTPLRKVEGPCDDPQAWRQQLTIMASTADLQTGRADWPASYGPGIDELLNRATPVWWITCTRGPDDKPAIGEVNDLQANSSNLNVAILLPSSLIAAGAGTLSAIARNTFDERASDPTPILLQLSPPMLGVVGDSIAWGQGISEPAKFYNLFATALPDAPPSGVTGRSTTGTTRVIVKAHSGSIVGSGTISGASNCTSRNPLIVGAGYGEIPRAVPIPCQIRDITAFAGEVLLPTGEDSRTPRFSAEHDPAGSVPISFDVGPRFDYVFITGGINDLQPPAILLGTNGYSQPEVLSGAIRRSCDMRNSIPDILQFLPNAVIAHLGYHVIVSDATNVGVLGCLPPPVTGVPGLPAFPLPACPGFALDDPAAVLCAIASPFAGQVAGRCAQFLRESNDAIGNSVAAIDRTSHGGRGQYLFMRLAGEAGDPFNAQTAFLAPASQTWGLTCGTPASISLLTAVDPVSGLRASACLAAINPTGAGSAEADMAEQSCRRASAFHPDTAGHVAIATTVVNALALRGLFRTP